MTGAVGRSLELYFIDGRPDGMMTAELFNWTGHVLMAPRTQIGVALERTEAGHTGVYLLIGEQDGEARAYIGEGDDISARIRAHDVRKEWWTSAVFITAAENKLNKAHVRYLEARLIAQARAIGRVPIDNATNPPVPSLSEADIAKMEAFLENLLIVLPALRVDMFIQRSRPAVGTGINAIGGQHIPVTSSAVTFPTARFALETKRHGLKATAVLAGGEFIVEAGSLARQNWVGQGTEMHSYAQLHEELRRSGILMMDGDHSRFTQNYAFRSPSAAAAVVTGRPANGQIEWREVGGGITYKEWEARQLSAAGVDAV
jgi:hypothetical protein